MFANQLPIILIAALPFSNAALASSFPCSNGFSPKAPNLYKSDTFCAAFLYPSSPNSFLPDSISLTPVAPTSLKANAWYTKAAFHPSFAPAANGVTPSRVFNFLTASTNSSYVSGSLAPALLNNVLLQNNVIYHENIGVEYNFPSYSNADVEPSTILDLTSSVK